MKESFPFSVDPFQKRVNVQGSKQENTKVVSVFQLVKVTTKNLLSASSPLNIVVIVIMQQVEYCNQMKHHWENVE